jgi:hypothetical protein
MTCAFAADEVVQPSWGGILIKGWLSYARGRGMGYPVASGVRG